MSRPSRANFKTNRESIFAGGPDLYRGENQASCSPHLEDCVTALQNCCKAAQGVQKNLREGTRDFPRLTKVLENQKVFVLTHEAVVNKYKHEMIDQVEATVHELIEQAERGLEALVKKEKVLRTKVENERTKAENPAIGATGTRKMEARQLQMLKKQKEKLMEEVRAMEAEVKDLESQTS